MIIRTLTPEEATERLRACGMKISTTAVRDGIQNRVFPFGDCVSGERTQMRFFVYERLLDEWIEARATP